MTNMRWMPPTTQGQAHLKLETSGEEGGRREVKERKRRTGWQKEEEGGVP